MLFVLAVRIISSIIVVVGLEMIVVAAMKYKQGELRRQLAFD